MLVDGTTKTHRAPYHGVMSQVMLECSPSPRPKLLLCKICETHKSPIVILSELDANTPIA